MKRRDFIKRVASVMSLFLLDPVPLIKATGNRPNAERKILGELLVDNCKIGELGLGAEAFSYGPHRQIYRAMVALHRDDEPVDLITLNWWLSKEGCLEAVGGTDYLVSLLDYS